MPTTVKENSMTAPSSIQRGIYAGIGSRATPPDVLELMKRLAHELAAAGWTLRTGGAKGADRAFLDGSTAAACPVEVYLPWPGFGGIPNSRLDRPTERAFEIAREHHPAWSACSSAAQALHARNSHQVLGETLEDPASFVVCYTPDGSLAGESREAGGTGQALRIASTAGVPVFNLKRPEHRERIEAFLAR